MMTMMIYYIYCDRPKLVIVNNSADREPISVKFYIVMGTQMGRFFIETVGDLVKGGQNGPEKK